MALRTDAAAIVPLVTDLQLDTLGFHVLSRLELHRVAKTLPKCDLQDDLLRHLFNVFQCFGCQRLRQAWRLSDVICQKLLTAWPLQRTKPNLCLNLF